MCKFWWRSSSQNGRGIHWISWDQMSRKKSADGIGFHKLQDFNIALLGKQGRRLTTQQDSLVSKVYKVCYYPEGSSLTTKVCSSPSYGGALWRPKFF